VLSLATVCAVGGASLGARDAMAGSAADKATARKLAREGIDLYKAGKYAEALDRMQRAEELYDAPVHLIYMARCQAKLGLVVEAAESYRRLVRTDLDAGAPQAFKDAVADAKKELPDVEPKIAQLRIDVLPKGVEGLKLHIDDTEVSSAVVGIDRPTNPGSRRVTASAPGYKDAEVSIELKPGERKGLSLTLQVDPSAKAATGKGKGAAGGGGDGGKKEGGDKGDKEEAPAAALGFIVGMRLGGQLPMGALKKDQPITDYYQSGGGGEFRGGIRFAQRYSVVLIGAGATHKPGPKLTADPGTTTKATPVAADAGVGFVYAPRRGDFGPFAELDVLFVHRFDSKREVEIGGNVCKQTLTSSGQALRLGGGAQIPVNSWFQLSPYATLALGQTTDVSMDPDCKTDLRGTPWEAGKTGAVDSEERTIHAVLGLGIGGDILFGGDNSKE
jgi:hypothetical protein